MLSVASRSRRAKNIDQCAGTQNMANSIVAVVVAFALATRVPGLVEAKDCLAASKIGAYPNASTSAITGTVELTTFSGSGKSGVGELTINYHLQ